MKQSELINQLTDQELKKSLIYSQLSLFIAAIILSFFLFESMTDCFTYFDWNLRDIFLFGIVPGIGIVLIDFILMSLLPYKYYDDGGINKRIFQSFTYFEIFYLTLFIAIAEEVLFRGVLQTTFGYVIASIIFAIVHVRYWKKPVLMVSILFVSFLIGYMFELTESLSVTIIAHFIVDFVLGIYIRSQNRGDSNG